MKRYIKDNKIRQSHQIIVHKNGKMVINPSEKLILEDGWAEYVIPEPTPEQLLQEAKNHLKVTIQEYDSSESVNSFTIQDYQVWLDKATRAGLMLRFQAEQASGKTDTVLWYNGMQFPLQIDLALQMLYAIELYASQCYDNTQKHLSMVDNITTLDDLNLYDYTQGYPDKLVF